MEETKTSPIPIRAITRGLEVLRIISFGGSMNMAEIARSSRLPYPTVCRIVNTLVSDGYVEREPARKRFRVTGLVQSLSHGFQNDSRLVEVSRSHLVRLTKTLEWPMIVATRLGSSMIVRDGTHELTSLTLSHYYPGFTFPILDSASGRAYLAYCSPEEREACLRGIEVVEGSDCKHAINLARKHGDLEKIRQDGFATRDRNSFTSPPGKNSSIAAPIFNGSEVCGALALVFFATAMPMKAAIERYASEIKEGAKAISKELRSEKNGGASLDRPLSVGRDTFGLNRSRAQHEAMARAPRQPTTVRIGQTG
ncbi:helix-turn-helix domain-containing protein [Parasphingopyxis algicola]|uniref:helix-turn-helix domain-containing protein n=1 Tax=Parasphingopyxis algicola TaxID=2026624 RepID=UPI0015A33B8F|nr:helix-turn-helix domain-containing protein [Parasphingopyxis algicola]QLC26355.1 helix-turn-helix domain-containing protein [Parasphingopyxis algicola]